MKTTAFSDLKKKIEKQLEEERREAESSNAPGSKRRVPSGCIAARSLRESARRTVFVSPGSSGTFSKPTTRRTGCVLVLSGSEIYQITVSAPARFPAFFTVTDASTRPPRRTATFTFPYSNVVYERPCPNGSHGSFSCGTSR